MKTVYRALLLGLTAGVCFWLVEALLSFFVYYDDEPFWETLFFGVNTHHFYARFLIILIAVVFARALGGLVGGDWFSVLGRGEPAVWSAPLLFSTLLPPDFARLGCILARIILCH